MKENRHDQERANTNRRILQKETQIEALDKEKQALEGTLEELEQALHRGFQKFTQLNEEAVQHGDVEMMALQSRNENQERAFHRGVQGATAQITVAYQKALTKMDDEREALCQKRSKIPWD